MQEAGPTIITYRYAGIRTRIIREGKTHIDESAIPLVAQIQICPAGDTIEPILGDVIRRVRIDPSISEPVRATGL